MAPLVSVVVPTRNYGAFIGRAVESITAQTYRPIECFVVDNGSTDNTFDVLAGFGAAVTVLRQPTPGPSPARNLGIRSSTGRYVAFLDADDWWHPEKLSRQIEFLESRADVGAVGCGIEFGDGEGRLQGSRDSPERASDSDDLIDQLRQIAVRRFWIGGSASGAVVRRDVFAEVGLWDETLPSAEDWDLWMRIAARYAIRNIPGRLVRITLHSAGTWRDPARREANQWRACDAALHRWPDALRPVANEMRALLLADVGGEYAAVGEHRQALRKYVASLRYWPYAPARWRAVASLAAKLVTGR